MNSQDAYVYCLSVIDKKQDNKIYKSFNVNDKDGVRSFLNAHKNKDTYYTYNTFKDGRTTNTEDNLYELKNIVIDLDYELQGGFTFKQANALLELLKPYFNASIPHPNTVVYSGGGIHLYFNIEPSTDIAKYKMVNRGIFEAVERCIGEVSPLTQVNIKVDPKHIGGYRFIRAIGTKNTKENQIATRIYHSKIIYSLDDLIENFVQDLKPIKDGTIKPLEYYESKTLSEFRKYRKNFTAMTWRYAAIDDLKALQASRNDKTRLSDERYYTTNIGNRNAMLFYLGVLAKWSIGDSAEVLRTMVAFNHFYGSDALSQKEVETTYKSVINHNYAPPKTTTLLKTLDIKPQEQKALKVLIGKEEVRERKNKAQRDKRAIQADSKVLAKQELIAKVKELHAQGLSYRAIAKALNISVGHAHKICI